MHKVNVDIAGQSITLFTDQNDDRVNKTVELVDQTCEDIMIATKMPLTHKTALLTAIKLAEQVVTLEEELKSLRSKVDAVTTQAINAIDEVLKPKES